MTFHGIPKGLGYVRTAGSGVSVSVQQCDQNNIHTRTYVSLRDRLRFLIQGMTRQRGSIRKMRPACNQNVLMS